MFRLISSTKSKLKPVFQNKTRNFFTIIPQGNIAYREFFGSERTKLEPGLVLNIPIAHDLNIISLREEFVSLSNQYAYTKDNVPIVISGAVYSRVFDAEKTCYNISDYRSSIKNVSESCFRSVVGQFDYDTIISERNIISSKMLEVLGNTTSDWGIEITRLEIQEFGPQNDEVAHQLEKQMHAERTRRENELQVKADIHTAEARKKIKQLDSEGDAISNNNRADAVKYEMERRSEGSLISNNNHSESIKYELQVILDDFDGNVADASNYLLEQQKLKHLQNLAEGPSNTVYFMSPDGIFPTTKVIGDILTNPTK
jgi:regulator of protease activity HflC (stomatin/prohibitin superfamily)